MPNVVPANESNESNESNENQPSQAELLAQRIKETFAASKTLKVPCALSAGVTSNFPRYTK